MDVDWAKDQVPRAELRLAGRSVGFPARLVLAPEVQPEPLRDDRTSAEPSEIMHTTESAGLCTDETCVRALREARVPQVVRVEFDADALSAALAEALVTALDGRRSAYPPAMPDAALRTPAATAKVSFWTGAWHADVVLSTIAILVVVVVLLAWTV